MSREGPAIGMVLATGLGSALGGGLRWQLALWLPAGGFPWATLLANTSGSALIGAYAALLIGRGADPLRRQFVMAGFCGGYTTFSLFSLETVTLLQAGELRTGLGYAAASVISWLAGVSIGFVAGRRFSDAGGP